MSLQRHAWFGTALLWVEQSAAGSVVRLTPHLYPVLESFHVLGIALLVGPTLAVDLRLLGVGRNAVPVKMVLRYLLPLAHVGFALVATTGLAMLTGVAVQVGSSAAAPWKFGLIVLAGLNTLAFHRGVYRTVDDWNLHASTPRAAKTAAVLSGSAWVGVIVAGRFLAY